MEEEEEEGGRGRGCTLTSEVSKLPSENCFQGKNNTVLGLEYDSHVEGKSRGFGESFTKSTAGPGKPAPESPWGMTSERARVLCSQQPEVTDSWSGRRD